MRINPPFVQLHHKMNMPSHEMLVPVALARALLRLAANDGVDDDDEQRMDLGRIVGSGSDAQLAAWGAVRSSADWYDDTSLSP